MIKTLTALLCFGLDHRAISEDLFSPKSYQIHADEHREFYITNLSNGPAIRNTREAEGGYLKITIQKSSGDFQADAEAMRNLYIYEMTGVQPQRNVFLGPRVFYGKVIDRNEKQKTLRFQVMYKESGSVIVPLRKIIKVSFENISQTWWDGIDPRSKRSTSLQSQATGEGQPKSSQQDGSDHLVSKFLTNKPAAKQEDAGFRPDFGYLTNR